MLVRHLMLFSILLVTAASAHAGQTQESPLLQIVQQYYQAHYELRDPKASNKDIDKIFTLFTKDFVYDHPGYGGVYSREDLYAGYSRNLAKGRYSNNEPIKIHNSIIGKDMVVVTKDEGQVTLFEFREGKITRIREYW